MFRGLKEDNNEWVYGSYFTWRRYGKDIPVVGLGVQNGSVIGDIVVDGTVGRFTGFQDSNDKMDFEDDMCRYKDYSGVSRIGVIKMQDGCWKIVAIGGDDEGSQDVLLSEATYHENLGSIHNPEHIGLGI